MASPLSTLMASYRKAGRDCARDQVKHRARASVHSRTSTQARQMCLCSHCDAGPTQHAPRKAPTQGKQTTERWTRGAPLEKFEQTRQLREAAVSIRPHDEVSWDVSNGQSALHGKMSKESKAGMGL